CRPPLSPRPPHSVRLSRPDLRTPFPSRGLLMLRFSCILLFVGTTAVAQTGPHFPTNEDLRHTRLLNDPRLSPDARSVLLTVTEPTVDSAVNHLWIIDVETKAATQLTFGSGRGEADGRWSPDGKTVYFTATRGEHTQLFRLPMGGGEAEPYVIKVIPRVDVASAPDAVDGSPSPTAPIESDISSYTISPDGRMAAILVRDPETPGEAKQKHDKADAHVVDQDPHGTRLYLLDLRTSALTLVTIAPDVAEAEWSHRSDRLPVVPNVMNNGDDLGPGNALWIVDVARPTAAQRVSTAPPTIRNVAWSAADTRLFFTAQAAADAPPGYEDLMAITLAGGAITNLSR